MPTLKEQLSETMKSAMKAKDKQTLTFARNLHAAIRKKEIDDKTDLGDSEVQKLALTQMKQRKESIDQYRKGGRDDLAASEEAELKFLEKFAPEQMPEDELRKHVDAAIAESGATEAKDLGKVMKVLMPKVQGRADGKLINQIVREKLSG